MCVWWSLAYFIGSTATTADVMPAAVVLCHVVFVDDLVPLLRQHNQLMGTVPGKCEHGERNPNVTDTAQDA